jgi:hypothetical protein
MAAKYSTRQAALIVLAVILLVGAVSVAAMYLPSDTDWRWTFRPAARALISGHSPYEVESFFNPPWGLLPLLPIALLPEGVGRAINMILTLAAFAFTAIRLGAKPVSFFFFMISPPVVHCLLTANIDYLVTLGFVLPPQIGLFFVLIKPQIGGAVALYWLVESWRRGALREVIRIFWPITVASLISFLLFGLWPLRTFGRSVDVSWNASLWPASIPLGLGLLTAAIHRQRVEYAMGASPCLSSYLALQSWVGALVALVSSVPETVAAVIGFWVLIIILANG